MEIEMTSCECYCICFTCIDYTTAIHDQGEEDITHQKEKLDFFISFCFTCDYNSVEKAIMF